jgi:hypothetical protein
MTDELKQSLSRQPLCQDGISCNKLNNGFIVARYLGEDVEMLKYICYDCYKVRKKQKDDLLLEMYGKINKVE